MRVSMERCTEKTDIRKKKKKKSDHFRIVFLASPGTFPRISMKSNPTRDAVTAIL